MNVHRIAVSIRSGLIACAVCAVSTAGPRAADVREAYLGPAALVVSADARTLYVANSDARQVACVELPAGRVVRRLDVPAEPTGLALSPDGTRLIVTCAAPKSTVLVLEVPSCRVLAAIRAGHTALGPAVAPDGRRLYVCNRFDNDVSVIDLGTARELARVKVVREPVAAAVTPDGEAVFVANHLPNDRADSYPLASVVTVIDTATQATTAISLPHGSHSLRGLCVSPDGKHVYVTHLLSNFELVASQLDLGWMSNNVVSVLDTQQRKVLQSVALDESYLGAGNPWGVACTSDGKWVCVSHAGTHELSVMAAPALLGPLVNMFTASAVGSIPSDLAPGTGVRRVALPGKGPRAVAVAGSQAYVAEYFSDSLAVVELSGKGDVPPAAVALGPKPRLTLQRRGELLFNDATICYQNWQSCASCHPDARTDVLNWDLLNDGIGNPKNTKSMVLATQTPPCMAEGVRPTAEAAVRSGLANILFSDRPEEEALAIDAYLQTLRAVPSPYLVEGRLSPAAQRGRQLFESERVGCSECHPAPLYTDLGMHNVSTRGPTDFTERFDTPTLVEVWRTAPYLHDGRYATIRELIVTGKHGKSRGHVEGLTAQEIDDLVEFVLSL